MCPWPSKVGAIGRFGAPDRAYAHGAAANLPQLRSQALADRLAPHRKPPYPIRPADVREAEEIERVGLSGKAMARTGLRMMPTFPSPPLKFRTAGFPQYGFKAGLSKGAYPA
jgi:hypothetical protein